MVCHQSDHRVIGQMGERTFMQGLSSALFIGFGADVSFHYAKGNIVPRNELIILWRSSIGIDELEEEGAVVESVFRIRLGS